MNKIGKLLIIVASTTVIIPYSIAFIAYLLYGRNSNVSKKWKSIIRPKKVIAINYAMLLEIKKLKFLKLYFQMTSFYKNASKDRLVKNISYGSNNNTLDIYIPQAGKISENNKLPIMVYIYGGSWSSGDKEMYGLLCSNISNLLSCIVVCPNLTIYPKGFVDDMVQDISDSLLWIQMNIKDYGGDKTRIGMIGHSSGAHLISLTLLEFAMKNKITDLKDSRLKKSSLDVSLVQQNSLEFKNSYFNGNAKQESSINVESSFIMVPSSLNTEASSSICILEESAEDDDSKNKPTDQTDISFIDGESNVPSSDIKSDFSIKSDSITNNKPTDSKIEKDITDSFGLDSRDIFEKILPSIKFFIGLAGVYDINDHYAFETERGIEDLSKMARAMYDEQQFAIFSPTKLVPYLSNINLLPPVYLWHGSSDTTVPTSSSLKFGETLSSYGHNDIHAIILTGCDHHGICVDMMDKRRGWHDTLLSQLHMVAQQHL